MPPESPFASPEPVRLRSVPLERDRPGSVAPGGPWTIPKPLTSLIGREADVAAVGVLIVDQGVRLVTLTGPGGVGKTRLALRVGEALGAEFPDGVVFVWLAAISDPELVLPTVMRALGLREDAARSTTEVLADALRQKRLLLVLDNFEQVRASAAHVATLLADCPELVILVTSRALLHIAGEQRFPVSPLALPEPVPAGIASAATSHVAAAPAVQLFVARARAIDPGFVLDEGNAGAVAAICRRLDGLPLAIELAAPRTLLLSPGELLARLRPALPFLDEGPEDVPDRLRTMRAAIAWSHDLLAPREQALFRRLAIFVGGFPLDAAEWVSGVGFQGLDFGDSQSGANADTRHPLPETLDLLATLVDLSLLQRTELAGETRFGMLETIREFALERLADSGELAVVSDRRAAWCVGLAEAAANAAGRAGSGDWMRRLAAERSNLWAVLDWCEQTGQTDAALQMTGALWHYWYPLGDAAEGRTRLERVLAAAPDGTPVLRAQALRGAGVLAWQSADYAVSRDRLEAALAIYRARADQAGVAWSLNDLGCLSATLAEQERAEAYFGEALALFRERGDAVGIAQLTTNLGELASVQGRHDLAIERLGAALALWRDLDNRVGAVRAQAALGEALVARGDLARADTTLREALTAISDIDYEQILPAVLRTAAQMAARRGDGVTAARRYGAADGIRERLGMEVSAARRTTYERAVVAVRDTLGTAAFAAAWDAGRALTLDEAIAEATSLAAEATPPGSGHLAAAVGLTAREREVLRLLVDGLSDKEIASELGIGRRTVSTHVAAVRAKLGAPSRSAAAAIAARDRLV